MRTSNPPSLETFARSRIAISVWLDGEAELVDEIALAHRDTLVRRAPGVVEFDGDPTWITVCPKNVDTPAQIDLALAEFDEVANDPGTPLTGRFRGQTGVPILEVHVCDAVHVLRKEQGLRARNRRV